MFFGSMTLLNLEKEKIAQFPTVSFQVKGIVEIKIRLHQNKSLIVIL